MHLKEAVHTMHSVSFVDSQKTIVVVLLLLHFTDTSLSNYTSVFIQTTPTVTSRWPQLSYRPTNRVASCPVAYSKYNILYAQCYELRKLNHNYTSENSGDEMSSFMWHVDERQCPQLQTLTRWHTGWGHWLASQQTPTSIATFPINLTWLMCMVRIQVM